MPINITLPEDQDTTPEEGIDEISPSLKLDKDDDELIRTVNKLVSQSKSLYETMIKEGSNNKKFWKGDQLDHSKMYDHQSKVVDNRLFLSMETIIPIMTSRTPEPTIRLGNSELREKTKQFLMNKWEVPSDDDTTLEMQALMEMISRHWMIYKVGVLKYWYDADIDDIRTEYRHPKNIIFDSEADNWYESRFLGEYVENTIDNLIERFPSKKKQIQEKMGDEQLGLSKVKYLEFWTDEYVCYKWQDIILEKKKNPNWDYGDMSEEDEKTEETDDKEGKYNLFKKPRMPYLVLNVFNLGENVYDDTSLLEQAKSLQLGVNKRKNQISDNVSDNGVLVGSGDAIDKKVLEAYTGNPKEKLWIKEGDVKNAIFRIPPKDLNPMVFQDLQDSKSEIDNIFGANSTTRGERTGQKTAQEANLLKTGDLGRIDLFSRALDRISQEWYTAMLHMKLVFCTEPETVNSNDEEGSEIVFDRKEYIDPKDNKLRSIKIKVKPGSAMSIDKDARRNEAFQLAQASLIDPISFFTKLDYSNPVEMAEKLWRWQNKPETLMPNIQAELQAEQAQQLAQQYQSTINSPLPEGTVLNLPEGSQQ